MDIANISFSIVSLVTPGIQGIFNKTLAVEMARAVNDQMCQNYSMGEYKERFGFWCNATLQNPLAAAQETKRCVKKLGGVGVMLGGYSNNGSVSDVVYLDDRVNEVFWKKLVELDVSLYVHPRMPPPNRQRVYQGWDFLAGSPWGFATETVVYALRLLVSGVFGLYPKL
jgi:predicted TIM-barrel fold metal-dependent hydrolase